MNLPIGIVFGTRPEYLKLKPLFSAFQREHIHFYIIQVNQHMDLLVEERDQPNFIYLSLVDDISVSRLNLLASAIPKLVEPTLKKCSSIIVFHQIFNSSMASEKALANGTVVDSSKSEFIISSTFLYCDFIVLLPFFILL